MGHSPTDGSLLETPIEPELTTSPLLTTTPRMFTYTFRCPEGGGQRERRWGVLPSLYFSVHTWGHRPFTGYSSNPVS